MAGWVILEDSPFPVTNNETEFTSNNLGKFAIAKAKDTLYLYNEGNECTSTTGGWTLGARRNDVDVASWDAYAVTTNTIDFTNYKTLNLTFKLVNGYTRVNIYLDSSKSYIYQTMAPSTIKTYTIDVSSITGAHTIMVSSWDNTCISSNCCTYSKNSDSISLSSYSSSRKFNMYKLYLE